MKIKYHYNIQKTGFAVVPILVLIVSLYYVTAFALLPDAGIVTDTRGGNGWLVTDVADCSWCSGTIEAGDVLQRVGDQAYSDNRTRPLNWENGPIEIERQREGAVEVITAVPASRSQPTRLLLLIYPLFFWLPATFIWYFAEKSPRRLLMAGTFFTYAVWVAAGTVSTSLVGGSSLMVHALSWMLLPLAVQMHWHVPNPLSEPRHWFWRGFYAVGVAAAGLELIHVLPDGLFYLPLAVQIVMGAGVVFWRLAQGRTETAVLMAAGQAIAFVPAMAWVVLVAISPESNGFMLVTAVTISLSAFPLLYTYANYKQLLGQKEAGFRRTAAVIIYLMLCFDMTAAAALTLGIHYGWTADLMSRHAAFAFTAAFLAVWIYRWFEGVFLRLLDGGVDTAVSQALALFSERMTDALNIEALGELLSQVKDVLAVDVLALYLQEEDGCRLHLAHGNGAPEMLVDCNGGLSAILSLSVRQKQIGSLLVGPQTRGGLYTPQHLHRLQNLANSIAAVLEIIQQREMLELQRETIVKQEKMASLGRMAASLAHQVNNPLQVIQGALEAHSGYVDGGPQDRWLGAAYRETLFLAKVVSSITKFAHPTLGSDEFVWLDVNEAVHEALLLVGEKIKQQNIHCSLQLGHNVGLVKMMPTDLTQVIGLLVDNACDAMAGGGYLTIRTFASHEATGATNSVVEITDTGEGIEEPSRVFEPFYTTKPKGHGFGLSIAYSIIERSNGTIRLRSKKGEGSAFEVRLPALM